MQACSLPAPPAACRPRCLQLKGMFLEVKEEILQRRFRPVVASPEQCGGGNVPSIGAGGDEGAQSGGQAISLGASMAEAGPSAEE